MFQNPHFFQTPAQCQASTAWLKLTKDVQRLQGFVLLSQSPKMKILPEGRCFDRTNSVAYVQVKTGNYNTGV